MGGTVGTFIKKSGPRHSVGGRAYVTRWAGLAPSGPPIPPGLTQTLLYRPWLLFCIKFVTNL
ncbi:Hypothetical protein FKW44_007666 [Caligus rogercresseyi]|uniref:Uncharacterized protein n=1 Tax=Caligus rogercresseyi TaxID=217165 RepID=A0A7T8QTR9_CALRO|nr:Hypothetical protein FKW44_007666 [Caligus rogercresseyi]